MRRIIARPAATRLVLLLAAAAIAVGSPHAPGASFTFDFQHPDGTGSAFSDAISLSTLGAGLDSLGQPIGFTRLNGTDPDGNGRADFLTLGPSGLAFNISTATGLSGGLLGAPFPTDGVGTATVTARYEDLAGIDAPFEQTGPLIGPASASDGGAGNFAIIFQGEPDLGYVVRSGSNPGSFSGNGALGGTLEVAMSAETVAGGAFSANFDHGSGAANDASLGPVADTLGVLGQPSSYGYVMLQLAGGTAFSGTLTSVTYSAPNLTRPLGADEIRFTITTADGQGADSDTMVGQPDTNFGGEAPLNVKDDGANMFYSHKAYLRFGLGSVNPAAILDATLKVDYRGSSAQNIYTLNVYGLNDGDAGEFWDESTITWNNAPANITTDGSALDSLRTTALGQLLVSVENGVNDAGPDIPVGGTDLTFSDPDLLSFLQGGAENDVATLILTRDEIHSNNIQLTAKEGEYEPPRLELTFLRGDFNFNRVLDAADWPTLRDNLLSDLTGMSAIDAYLHGDQNGDFVNDVYDYLIFRENYIAANGAGAFAALLQAPVPEPSCVAFVLLAPAVSLIRCRRVRDRVRPAFWLAVIVGVGSCTSVLPSAEAAMTHQYTFNDGTATDSIAAAEGTLFGAASIAGGQLVLPGGGTGIASDHLRLLANGADGINISGYTNATFELWATTNVNAQWSRYFDFGGNSVAVPADGGNTIFLTPEAAGANRLRGAISNVDINTQRGWQNEQQVASNMDIATGVEHHVALTYDGTNDTMRLYFNGAQVGQNLGATHMLELLQNDFALLGGSLYAVDPGLNGSINEFRLYDHVLSATQIAQNEEVGPTRRDLLVLDVNTTNNVVTLKNASSGSTAFNYYQITSDNGELDPAGWVSVDPDDGIPGNDFEKSANSNSFQLIEGYLGGNLTLASDEARSLGAAWNPAPPAVTSGGDLLFQFVLDSGDVRRGAVFYGPNHWAGGNGSWSNPAAWSHANLPNHANAQVQFGNTVTSPTNVTVDADVAVSEIIFDHPTQDYTLAGDGTHSLTLAGDAIIDVVSGSHTISAPIVANNGFRKRGIGTLVLDAANSYSGTTTISEGTVVLGSTTALGTGPVTLSDGSTGIDDVALLLSIPGATIVNPITVAADGTGTVTVGTAPFVAPAPPENSEFSGTLTLNRDAVLQGGSTNRTTFRGQITGAGNLTITTAVGSTHRRVVFDRPSGAANNFIGDITIAEDARLQLGVANSIGNRTVPDTSTLYYGNAVSTLRLTPTGSGDSETVGTLVSNNPGAGVVVMETGAAFTLLIGGDNESGEFSGTIGNSAGSLAIRKVGAGTQILSGANTYTGGTTISAGALQIGSGGTTGSIAGNIANNSNLIFNRSGNLVYGGVISGTGSVTMVGTGSLNLSGASSYTGTTTVATGTLLVNGTHTGGGAYTVSPGATLGGSGTIEAPTTNGGRLAPGNSPGIMVIDGDYTQEANGVLEIEVGGLTPGSGHDQLVVSGMATLDGVLSVPIINNFMPQVDDEITFLTANEVAGTFSGLVSPNLASVDPNLALRVIYNATDVQLQFVAPSTDVQFDAETTTANWSDTTSWTTATVPGTTNILNIQNLTGTPQQLNVAAEDALTHGLTVTGATSTITVAVQNGSSLSATTGVTIGNQGVIALNTGSLVSSEIEVASGGQLTGNGTVVGNLMVGTAAGGQEATLSPGFSVGQLEVDGDYEQGAGGTLLVDVEDLNEGEFDTVNVSGKMTPGGTLRVDASNLVAPIPGSAVPIISAGSLAPGSVFQSVETIGNDDVFFAPIYNTQPGAGAASSAGGASGGNDSCLARVCVAVFLEGDMNRDGFYDDADVQAFALALTKPLDYFGDYFIFGHESGDVDDNGLLDFDDIDDFADLMGGSGATTATILAAIEHQLTVPEPAAALSLLIGSLLTWMLRFHRQAEVCQR